MLTRDIKTAVYATAVIWLFLAAAMAPPTILDYIDGSSDWRVFFGSMLLVGGVAGVVGLALRGEAPRLTPRLGFLMVNIMWSATAVAAAVPFYFSKLDLNAADAIFESMSGLTTTGSTVIVGLDYAPRGILLWRSMTQWFGGIGILSLGFVLLPFLRVGGMQLFRVESSDNSGKPLPKFLEFSKALLLIYVGLTVACAAVYAGLGMSGFDAINHAMTTISTGGYSTHDASMGYFANTPLLWAAALFMLLGGLPFALYVQILFSARRGVRDPQAPVFLAIVVVAALSLVAVRAGLGVASGRSMAEDVFSVISVITTTGFAAGDYSAWGGYATGLFFLLTFLGGCAGSTAGGIKTYRLIVMFQLVRAHLAQLARPSGVFPLRYGGKVVDPAIFRSAMVFFMGLLLSLAGLTVALCATGLDLLTALTGAATALANVGPGLGEVIGPSGNFAPLSDSAKWLLSLGMLMGRLEIMTFFVLLSPGMWRD